MGFEVNPYDWCVANNGFMGPSAPSHGMWMTLSCHTCARMCWRTLSRHLTLSFDRLDPWMEVDWGGKIKPNQTTSECMLTEVDWGAHDSSFFLYLKYIDHNGKPKHLFTQGLWGRLPQKTSSTPLIEYLKDSLDSGQTEDGFFNFKSIKECRGSYSLPDPGQLESSYNLLTEWTMGRKLGTSNQHHGRIQALWKFQSKLFG